MEGSNSKKSPDASWKARGRIWSRFTSTCLVGFTAEALTLSHMYLDFLVAVITLCKSLVMDGLYLHLYVLDYRDADELHHKSLYHLLLHNIDHSGILTQLLLHPIHFQIHHPKPTRKLFSASKSPVVPWTPILSSSRSNRLLGAVESVWRRLVEDDGKTFDQKSFLLIQVT